MLLSRFANPNSVQAHNARMMDQAGLNAAYRERNALPAPTAMAHDVKCHVDSVGHLESGFRMVYLTARGGERIVLMLDVRDEHLVDRLKAARASGECLEIVYEAMRSMILKGRILTIS